MLNSTLSAEEKILLRAGLFLYWGEGAKSKPYIVDFANSDVKMVRIFLATLRHIYKVQENRLRILLYCYANQNPNELVSYWSETLHIPRSQFTKPYIRRDYDVRKIHKMHHGLVHVRYNDKKLFMQIINDIDIISTTLITRWDGRAAKYTSL